MCSFGAIKTDVIFPTAAVAAVSNLAAISFVPVAIFFNHIWFHLNFIIFFNLHLKLLPWLFRCVLFCLLFFLHFHFGRTKYRLNGFIVSIWKITKNLNGFIVTAQRERDRHGESILFSIACWQLVFHSFQNVKWFYLFQLNAERFITGKINAILTQKHRVCVCFA